VVSYVPDVKVVFQWKLCYYYKGIISAESNVPRCKGFIFDGRSVDSYQKMAKNGIPVVNYFHFMVMGIHVACGQGIPMENRVARKRWIQGGQRLSKKSCSEGMSVYIY
jgi:hypothetical protein